MKFFLDFAERFAGKALILGVLCLILAQSMNSPFADSGSASNNGCEEYFAGYLSEDEVLVDFHSGSVIVHFWHTGSDYRLFFNDNNCSTTVYVVLNLEEAEAFVSQLQSGSGFCQLPARCFDFRDGEDGNREIYVRNGNHPPFLRLELTNDQVTQLTELISQH